ncbi:hypothetical protein FRAAL5107 [Frankia alni ACN14a]|uniref:Uncharacterized protein n=1 Tax=Frankia alni (strain DSM 45986 / CECT 9034 / ACN14a) TaxID=326424 RepID=Q0RFJ6_FRAAA|nr:hypothetical protein FRAAL5107 [Frankia alni ACN14a]
MRGHATAVDGRAVDGWAVGRGAVDGGAVDGGAVGGSGVRAHGVTVSPTADSSGTGRFRLGAREASTGDVTGPPAGVVVVPSGLSRAPCGATPETRGGHSAGQPAWNAKSCAGGVV